MASQHQRQIQQMKAFILQEAAEKRNEINIKVGKERRAAAPRQTLAAS